MPVPPGGICVSEDVFPKKARKFDYKFCIVVWVHGDRRVAFSCDATSPYPYLNPTNPQTLTIPYPLPLPLPSPCLPSYLRFFGLARKNKQKFIERKDWKKNGEKGNCFHTWRYNICACDIRMLGCSVLVCIVYRSANDGLKTNNSVYDHFRYFEGSYAAFPSENYTR